MILEINGMKTRTENKVEVLYEKGSHVIYDPKNIEHLMLNERDVTAVLILKGNGQIPEPKKVI